MQTRTAAAVIVLLGWAILNDPADAAQIVVGPYLQAPLETSMTLMWITDVNCVSWVEYGQDESLDQKAHHSEHGLIAANQTIHKVTIEGLSPGEKYRYRVCSREIVAFKPYDVTYGDTVTSDTHSFTTLDDQKDNISFIVLNDIHEQNETLVTATKLAQARPRRVRRPSSEWTRPLTISASR